MKLNSNWIVFLLPIFLFLRPTQSLAQEASEKHMLWKISSEEGVEGYLAGSIHIVKPEMYPLDPIFKKTFKKADVIGFELNLDSMRIKSMSLLPKLGFYPMGETIKDHLSEKTYRKLKTKLQKLGMPMIRANRMEPWLLALTIPVLEMKKSGYTAQGIDKHLFQMAKERGKEIMGLETVKYQLNLFDDLSEELQKKYLKYTLKNDQSTEKVDQIVAYWKAGKAKKMHAVMKGEMKKFSKKVYHKLLIQRNLNWIPKIQAILKTEKTPMIVVGAGHLVGPKGVPALLEKKGYTVEQM